MSAQETGVVLSTQDGEALVRFSRTEACKKCGACQKGEDGNMLMQLRNDMNAKPGDHVVVELAEGRLMQASLLAYGFPLAMLLLGLVLGYYALPSLLPQIDQNLLAIALALALTAVSMICLRWTEKRRKRKGQYMPKAVLVSPPNDPKGGMDDGQ